MFKLKAIKDISVCGKRVLIRVDFNIPFTNTKIDKSELWKLEAVIPTLKYLIKKEARIILIAHLGRPRGRVVKELRLDFIAKKLGYLLKRKVKKIDCVIGKKAQKAVNKMKPGDILILENVRFCPGEEKNSPKFAKELAKLGDVFINEAFAVSHRKHASIAGVPKYLPAVAGMLFEKEIKELNKILHKPKRPLVIIIGGAKIITKIKIIKKSLERADKLLLGGALADTIFAAKGLELGKSLVEKGMFKIVNDLDIDNSKLELPIDFVCQTCLAGRQACLPARQDLEISIKGINAVKKNESVFDIGPRTVGLFLESIKKAKMITWNGPLGLIEKEPFDRGSEFIARAIAKSRAYSIIGGGDTVAFIKKLKLEKKINYISTGGGAMLEYLANETLPGIEVLRK